MADRDYRVTAVEVEILGAFVVPHFATFAFNDVYVEKRIYVI